MGDTQRDKADKLDREGEEPAAESGAGYGDHAPSPEEKSENEAEE